MTLTELLADFYSKARETSSNTFFTSANVTNWLNEGYYDLLARVNWPFLQREVIKTPVYTTFTSYNSGTLTIVVGSASNMFAGQYLWVQEGDVIERVTISSISGTSIVVESPGLVYTFTTSAIVASGHVQGVASSDGIVQVEYEYVTASDRKGECLTLINDDDFRKEHSRIETVSTPTHYYIMGKTTGDTADNIILYPIPDSASYRIRVFYRTRPSVLSGASDSPVFPAIYHHLLTYYALSIGVAIDGDLELAGRYYNIYSTKRERMVQNLCGEYNGQLPVFEDGLGSELPEFRW